MSASEIKKLKKLQEKQRQRELKAIFGEKENSNIKQTENEETADDIIAEAENEILEELEMTLEDIIEKERNKIQNGTPVNAESFARWKKFKLEQKEKEREIERNLRDRAIKGKTTGLSGKELFEMNANIFEDDEAAVGKEDLVIDEDLFLDSDDEDKEETNQDEEIPEWDPSTWKEVDPPKQKLQDYISKVLKLKNDSYPQYEEIVIQSGGFLFKITLPHINKTLVPLTPHQNKKNAQNAAAYLALKYLENLNQKQ